MKMPADRNARASRISPRPSSCRRFPHFPTSSSAFLCASSKLMPFDMCFSIATRCLRESWCCVACCCSWSNCSGVNRADNDAGISISPCTCGASRAHRTHGMVNQSAIVERAAEALARPRAQPSAQPRRNRPGLSSRCCFGAKILTCGGSCDTALLSAPSPDILQLFQLFCGRFSAAKGPKAAETKPTPRAAGSDTGNAIQRRFELSAGAQQVGTKHLFLAAPSRQIS
jgi:hypothetical protein